MSILPTLDAQAITEPGIRVIPVSDRFEIRVFASGWREVAPGESKEIIHNLGGDPDWYFVYMDFYKTSTYPEPAGVHQIFYGQEIAPSGPHGMNWEGLDATRIFLHRGSSDFRVEKARVRIVAFVFK
jgi:hypothetical protein